MFVFCQKHFRTSYVCPTQTMRRHLSLQCVCFLEVLPLKKVFKTSSSGRGGLISSRVFYPLPVCSFETNLITLASPSISASIQPTHIDLHICRSPHLHSVDTSIQPTPPSSRHLYRSPPPSPSKTHLHRSPPPSISIFTSVEALTSINLHLHLRRSPHLHLKLEMDRRQFVSKYGEHMKREDLVISKSIKNDSSEQVRFLFLL
ncbi:putative DNA-directed RNA polymerase subunit Rpb5 [Helianthus debilis subsp. tardiflorus]